MKDLTANHRYKIRTFEARDGSRSLVGGTIVLPKNTDFFLYAPSVDHTEQLLCEQVRSGKRLAGQVFQICPLVGNPEAIRFVAIDSEARPRRLSLDAALGMYSVFRSIRYFTPSPSAEEFALEPEAVTA